MIRAIRKRYLPRSAPHILDQTRVYARRAAFTARSTSASFGLGDLGEHLLGARADRLERLAVTVDELAVDEEPVRRLDVDDRARLGRGCVFEVQSWPSFSPGSRSRDRSSAPVVILERCISRSLSRVEAPNRNQSGSSQSSPAISLTITRYLIASLLCRMPPAGLTPTIWPVASRKSRTASSITSVTGSVAAGCTLPVEVLMKCAAGHHRQPAGPADVVVGLQLAGLEDHLEVARCRRPRGPATISS